MLVAAIVLLCTVAAVPPQAPTTRPTTRPTTAPAKAVDPHGSADGCRNCHAVEADAARPIAASAIDSICLKCHDGRQATRERHPIGRTFASRQITLPDGWPTHGGKLGCVTCHDIRSACEQQRSAANPAFVRGYRAGNLIGFCGRCHEDGQAYQRYDPHVMLAGDKEPIERVCRFCHLPAIDQHDGAVRTGRPALRADEITLCLGCHGSHKDYYEPGHIGAPVNAEMKARVRVARPKPNVEFATPAFSATVQSGQCEPLPLGKGDVIVCSTCHNPHQDGTFAAGNVLDQGGLPVGEGRGVLPLRGFGAEVCGACHEE